LYTSQERSRENAPAEGIDSVFNIYLEGGVEGRPRGCPGWRSRCIAFQLKIATSRLSAIVSSSFRLERCRFRSGPQWRSRLVRHLNFSLLEYNQPFRKKKSSFISDIFYGGPLLHTVPCMHATRFKLSIGKTPASKKLFSSFSFSCIS